MRPLKRSLIGPRGPRSLFSQRFSLESLFFLGGPKFRPGMARPGRAPTGSRQARLRAGAAHRSPPGREDGHPPKPPPPPLGRKPPPAPPPPASRGRASLTESGRPMKGCWLKRLNRLFRVGAVEEFDEGESSRPSGFAVDRQRRLGTEDRQQRNARANLLRSPHRAYCRRTNAQPRTLTSLIGLERLRPGKRHNAHAARTWEWHVRTRQAQSRQRLGWDQGLERPAG